jgi:hypothetical protein
MVSGLAFRQNCRSRDISADPPDESAVAVEVCSIARPDTDPSHLLSSVDETSRTGAPMAIAGQSLSERYASVAPSAGGRMMPTRFIASHATAAALA